MNEKDFDDEEKEELRLLYQISVDDIKYAKGRQWAIIYYVLLTLAAIVAFYRYTAGRFFAYENWFEKSCLLLPAYFISFIAMYHLMDSQKCQCFYRMRLTAIKRSFKETTQDILAIKPEGFGLKLDSFFWSWFFPIIIFIIVLVFYFRNDLILQWYSWSLIVLSVATYFLIAKLTKNRSASGEEQYKKFGYYFGSLIFPFIILMLVGVFYLAWLLLRNEFSLLSIIIVVLIAEAVIYFPLFLYYLFRVEKAQKTR